MARLAERIRDGHITIPYNTLISCYGAQPAEAVLRGMYLAGSLERRYGLRNWSRRRSPRVRRSLVNSTAAWPASKSTWTWRLRFWTKRSARWQCSSCVPIDPTPAAEFIDRAQARFRIDRAGRVVRRNGDDGARARGDRSGVPTPPTGDCSDGHRNRHTPAGTGSALGHRLERRGDRSVVGRAVRRSPGRVGVPRPRQ